MARTRAVKRVGAQHSDASGAEDGAVEHEMPRHSLPIDSVETRAYRCLVNVSKGGRMHVLGSTVELTAAQARPIMQYLEEL